MATPAPLTCVETTVRPEWVDYNGHMNDAAYAQVFSQGIDALMNEWLGIDATFREEQHYTLFTLEMHIRYLQEAHEGQALAVDVRVVDHDAKRLHLLMALRRTDGDATLATGEVMLMGMDSAAGRPGPFPPSIAERVEALWQRHGYTEWPEEAGRSIGIRRK